MIANRIRRNTTLSRHVLTELETLKMPRLQTVLSEAVSFGEISFSGVLPRDGTSASEITSLMRELRKAGWLPTLRKVVKAATREAVKP